MLRFLRIRHLAVIDQTEIELDAGFNVLTGETGTGKSILVEAVSLLLGGRASADLVRTGAESAVVEAIFERGQEECLIRREISAEGRSRAFVNNELTTVQALRDMSSTLIEIHGQHEHHTLKDPSAHLSVLDAFGQLDVLPVSLAFERMTSARRAVEDARRAAAERDQRRDLVEFQLAELERADLKAPTGREDGAQGEDADLAALRHLLMNAERVQRLCADSLATLYDNDDAVLTKLAGVWKQVGELAAVDPAFEPYLAERNGIKSALEDLASFLRRYSGAIEASPARLQQLEERLALLERLKRKYGPTLSDVIARRTALRLEVDAAARGGEQLEELDQAAQALRAQFIDAARTLSAQRRGAAARLVHQLERLLRELAMNETRVDVRFAEEVPETGWNARGIDAVEFLISPNPGEELRPLARIASGGELSRVMLAIKSLMHMHVVAADDERSGRESPGLIFDEVDAGIGGRAADVVGRHLRALGSRFQVLCITHLPTVAAYADRHIRVDKRVESERTYTNVVRLDRAGRIDELARMLGGEGMSESIRRAASDMLSERSGEASVPSSEEQGRKAKIHQKAKAKAGPERHGA